MEETDVQAQAEQTPIRFEIERPEDYSQYLLHSKAEIVAVDVYKRQVVGHAVA